MDNPLVLAVLTIPTHWFLLRRSWPAQEHTDAQEPAVEKSYTSRVPLQPSGQSVYPTAVNRVTSSSISDSDGRSGRTVSPEPA